MRFTSVASGALALLASVHGAAAQTTASQTYSLSPAESSTAACLKQCTAGDVECQSHCIAVPAPDEDDANRTTKCVAECPQGNGTEEQTARYASCIEKCISENFFASASGTPAAPTGEPGSGSDDGTSDDSGSGSGSDSDADATETADSSSTADSTATVTTGSIQTSTSSTDSAATETATPDAAPALMASSLTIFGVIVAVLAL